VSHVLLLCRVPRFLYCYVECRYTECRYAECRSASQTTVLRPYANPKRNLRTFRVWSNSRTYL
jgi:hypothetical protein